MMSYTPLLILITLLGLFSSSTSTAFDAVKGVSQDGFLDVTVEKRSPTTDSPKVNFDSLGNLNTALVYINKYRVAHQVAPVTWNMSLAQYAARAAYPCQFRPSGGPYGEVLVGSSTVNNPEWFIWFLYHEIDGYDFKNPKVNDPATKHFTQIVWKDSKQVGCAFVNGCHDLKYQLWCEFSPKGNTGSQLAYRNNVKVADKSKEIPGMPPAII
ncbi:hypothetical protein TWF281_004445 [Arthrobotrys megalospora]